MTALTLYFTNTAGTTLSTSNQISITHGTDNTNVTQDYSKLGTATGWGEICAQGATASWAAGGSIGSPTGNGFMLETAILNLNGDTLTSGSFTANIRLCMGHTDGTQTGSVTGVALHMRVYKYNSGVYTSICDLSLTGQTVNSTLTTYALTGSAGSSVTFGSGDLLYVDCWANVGTNSNSDSILQFRLNRISTNSTGDSNFEVVTQGYTVVTNNAYNATDALSTSDVFLGTYGPVPLDGLLVTENVILVNGVSVSDIVGTISILDSYLKTFLTTDGLTVVDGISEAQTFLITDTTPPTDSLAGSQDTYVTSDNLIDTDTASDTRAFFPVDTLSPITSNGSTDTVNILDGLSVLEALLGSDLFSTSDSVVVSTVESMVQNPLATNNAMTSVDSLSISDTSLFNQNEIPSDSVLTGTLSVFTLIDLPIDACSAGSTLGESAAVGFLDNSLVLSATKTGTDTPTLVDGLSGSSTFQGSGTTIPNDLLTVTDLLIQSDTQSWSAPALLPVSVDAYSNTPLFVESLTASASKILALASNFTDVGLLSTVIANTGPTLFVEQATLSIGDGALYGPNFIPIENITIATSKQLGLSSSWSDSLVPTSQAGDGGPFLPIDILLPQTGSSLVPIFAPVDALIGQDSIIFTDGLNVSEFLSAASNNSVNLLAQLLEQGSITVSTLLQILLASAWSETTPFSAQKSLQLLSQFADSTVVTSADSNTSGYLPTESGLLQSMMSLILAEQFQELLGVGSQFGEVDPEGWVDLLTLSDIVQYVGTSTFLESLSGTSGSLFTQTEQIIDGTLGIHTTSSYLNSVFTSTLSIFTSMLSAGMISSWSDVQRVNDTSISEELWGPTSSVLPSDSLFTMLSSKFTEIYPISTQIGDQSNLTALVLAGIVSDRFLGEADPIPVDVLPAISHLAASISVNLLESIVTSSKIRATDAMSWSELLLLLDQGGVSLDIRQELEKIVMLCRSGIMRIQSRSGVIELEVRSGQCFFTIR